MMVETHPRFARMKDTSGASIVIALVFFLICGIVGSVVVTAASVQAKSVQTHVDMQQMEYTMLSAAELVAQQLGGVDSASGEHAVTVQVKRDDQNNVVIDTDGLQKVTSELGRAFWTPERTKAILGLSRGGTYVVGASSDSRVEIRAPREATDIALVYARITVDADLNMIVDLSLEETLAATSPYNMTVSIPCTPTFNAAGQVTAFTYGDNTVIEKAS